jgi:hypothetical protein
MICHRPPVAWARFLDVKLSIERAVSDYTAIVTVVLQASTLSFYCLTVKVCQNIYRLLPCWHRSSTTVIKPIPSICLSLCVKLMYVTNVHCSELCSFPRLRLTYDECMFADLSMTRQVQSLSSNEDRLSKTVSRSN